jgi:hypothetical protein
MLAGEIEETSKREILDRVKFLEKIEAWWGKLNAVMTNREKESEQVEERY